MFCGGGQSYFKIKMGHFHARFDCLFKWEVKLGILCEILYSISEKDFPLRSKESLIAYYSEY